MAGEKSSSFFAQRDRTKLVTLLDLSEAEYTRLTRTVCELNAIAGQALLGTAMLICAISKQWFLHGARVLSEAVPLCAHV